MKHSETKQYNVPKKCERITRLILWGCICTFSSLLLPFASTYAVECKLAAEVDYDDWQEYRRALEESGHKRPNNAIERHRWYTFEQNQRIAYCLYSIYKQNQDILRRLQLLERNLERTLELQQEDLERNLRNVRSSVLEALQR